MTKGNYMKWENLSFLYFFFPINIPITKCVAYEDCTTEILSLKNYLYTLTNYIITFS